MIGTIAALIADYVVALVFSPTPVVACLDCWGFSFGGLVLAIPMGDAEIVRLHRRIDKLEQLFRDHDTANAARFDEMRRCILGDSVDLDQPGILRRILLLETHKTRVTRNAQVVWGFLLTIVVAVFGWLLGLFRVK